jgi:hypothetical protein
MLVAAASLVDRRGRHGFGVHMVGRPYSGLGLWPPEGPPNGSPVGYCGAGECRDGWAGW